MCKYVKKKKKKKEVILSFIYIIDISILLIYKLLIKRVHELLPR